MNPKPILVFDKETLKPQYEAAIREKEELTAKLKSLEKLVEAMEDFMKTLGPSESRILDIPRSMILRPKRAPYGALKAAILSLTGPNPLTNAEVKQGLIDKGYPHPIESMNLRKTLDRMAEGKELIIQDKDGRIAYSRPKGRA